MLGACAPQNTTRVIHGSDPISGTSDDGDSRSGGNITGSQSNSFSLCEEVSEEKKALAESYKQKGEELHRMLLESRTLFSKCIPKWNHDNMFDE